MSWIKKLWNWIVRKTSTAPKLAVVEEEKDSRTTAEIATSIFMTQYRARPGELGRLATVEQFEEWYDGEANEKDIAEAIVEFKKAKGIRFGAEVD